MMTIEVGAQLLHYQTATELWTEARALTCASTKARVMVIKSELHNTRKNSMRMDEYLNKMQGYSDELALAGAPLANEDLILHTLNGLDAEYNAIVVKLVDNTDLTWIEAQASLISFETRLNQLNHFSNLSIQPTVNFAQKREAAGDSRRDSSRFRNWRGGSHNSRGGGHFRGRRGNRPFCVYCQCPGHTLVNCYYRDEHDATAYSSSPQAHYATPYSISDSAWYMHSGVNYYVTPDSEQPDQVTAIGKSNLTTCTGEKNPILGIGHTSIPCGRANLILKDILYVPSANKNLMSVNKLIQDNPVRVNFSNTTCDVKDMNTGVLLLQGRSKGGMYPMEVNQHLNVQPECFNAEPTVFASTSDPVQKLRQWHHTLGHPSNNVLRYILHNNSSLGSTSKMFIDDFVCEACQLGKSKSLPFSNSVSQSSSLFELIHTDLWGPAPITSTGGHRFYVHFLDDYNRYTWIYPLKHKGETINAFKHFKAFVETQFNLKIKAIQCDNGTEFKPLIPIANEEGIQLRYTCPYTSAQNGRAERKHRHIVETGLTLLAYAHMPLHFWFEAFQMAVFLINRLPTPVLHNQTPLFLLKGTDPVYTDLKLFGCACYPCLKPYNSHKFEFRSQRCVYLGLAAQHKGYKCLSATGRIFISRHVVFDPLVFPFSSGFLSSSQNKYDANNSSLVVRFSQDSLHQFLP